MKRILCLRLAQWPIQRIQAEEPAYRGQPIVIFGTIGRLQRRVVMANFLAGQQGVRVGMPLVEVRKDYSGLLLPQTPEADLQTLEQLAIACQRFTPITGTRSSDPDGDAPDSIFLDITKTSRLFGGEEPLCSEVLKFVHRQYFQAFVAIGNSIAITWAMTWEWAAAVANQGADTKNHRLQMRISPQDSDRALQEISAVAVAGLRTSEKIGADLKALGIETIGQVLSLPTHTLPSRFGTQLTRRIDQLRGHAEEVIQVCRDPSLPQWRHTLEHPSGQYDVIMAILQLSIEKILPMLAQRQQGVMSLDCQLFSPQRSPIELSLRLVQPNMDIDYLMQLIDLQMQRQSLPREVTAIQVDVPLTADYRPTQQWLFPDQADARRKQRGALIERLLARLGEAAVFQFRFQSQALPERNFVPRKRLTLASSTAKSAASPKPKSRRRATGPAADRDPVENGADLAKSDPAAATQWPMMLERPARLFAQPKRLRVIGQQRFTLPASRFTVPQEFGIGEQIHSTCFASGPERIESQWWEGRWVRRDYFRVSTVSGHRFWIFQNTSNHQWYLHGDFA